MVTNDNRVLLGYKGTPKKPYNDILEGGDLHQLLTEDTQGEAAQASTKQLEVV